MGRSGKGSTTVGRPGWFPRVVTETDTGHEGPERPRGPTGGPLAATDGERRVGRALPRHGHALPTEPAILEFSNSTPLFQLRSSEVLGANVAPRTHGGRRLPGRPPGECAPRSTEAGADAAPTEMPVEVTAQRCAARRSASDTAVPATRARSTGTRWHGPPAAPLSAAPDTAPSAGASRFGRARREPFRLGFRPGSFNLTNVPTSLGYG